jgi:hypothetical protein
VALHLLGGDLANIARRRDRFDGARASGYTGNLGDPAALLAFINDWNQVWVQAGRRLSPALLCDLLVVSGDWLHTYYASLDPHLLGSPVSWAGPAPAPVWLDLAREYTEHWTHQQHIRDAVSRPGLKERHWFGPVLATFVQALPHTLRQVDRPPGAILQLTIAGDAGGDWLAVRETAGWALTTAQTAPPTATVTIDQEVAWRLFTRGLDPTEAEASAFLDGDLPLARAALTMVSMIV